MAADLYPRIRAAIEGRLELARAATPGPWRTVWRDQEFAVIGGEHDPDNVMESVAEWTYAVRTWEPEATADRAECDTTNAAFIAANHPAWAIRALEADLERLDRHVPQGWGEDTIRRHPAVTDERWCAWCADRALAWPCPEVFALARVYLEEEA